MSPSLWIEHHVPVCRKTSILAPALVTICAVIACVGEGSVSASGTLPVSPTFLNATAAYNGLQVRPARITYTGDGTGFLGGARVRDQHGGIRWSSWTPAIARGAGFNQLDDCEPDCARGKFHGYAVRIELWRPETLAGTLVFTRMTIFYQRGRPRGEAHHYTFTDMHVGATSGGGYSWGPPDAFGYCTHTNRQPPAPDCKNIHSLP